MTVATVEGLAYPLDDQRSLRVASLTVAPGERLVVFGPNGSGKTTLLRLLAGTLRGAKGTVTAPAPAYLPQRPYLFRGTSFSNVMSTHSCSVHPESRFADRDCQAVKVGI